MPNKKFLEEYPLYKKFKVEDLYDFSDLDDVPKPAIHMYCDRCDSDQTFNMHNEYYENERNSKIKIPGIITRALYFCSACDQGQRVFLIKFLCTPVEGADEDDEEEAETDMYLMKVGQYPAWSIETDKELERLLGAHKDYYKRGLICESQSYGIGAYAYFRRITEDVIVDLLNLIPSLIEDKDNREKYLEKLKEVKKQKITEKKIELVKDLLPPSLQADGHNPLKTLHSALSQGLHGKSDEECMKYAEIIRKVLVYLVNQIIRTKESKKEYTVGLKKLLGK
ncbi:MAG: hypothetical protein HQ538_00585 [Parcubacteria group bacterium]|nr:hypothetical protein [Parcubacteria group bacterium]